MRLPFVHLFSFFFKPAIQQEQIDLTPFSVVEEKTKVSIKLNMPEIVYLKDKTSNEIREELISQISAFISLGRTVEINCGEVNPKTSYITDELLRKEIIDLIEKQDDQKVEAKKEQRLVGRRNCGFVIYENKEERRRSHKIINFDRLPKFTDYVPEEDTDFHSNKYLDAPSLVIEKPIYFYLDQLNEMLKKHLIVQIRRKKLHGRLEELGMYVEKDPKTQEIILNLNGQNEFHFIDLFIPLALHYLQKQHPVLIDCDVDSSIEDMEKLEEKISQGNTYEQIYKGIIIKTKAEIFVERKTTNPNTNEEHNFIVIKQRKTQKI